MKAIPFLVAAVATAATVATARAADAPPATAPYNSWYVGLDLVGSHTRDSDVSGGTGGTIHYDNSLSLGDLKAGYRPQALYNDAGDVRFEVELLSRSAGIDSVSSGGQSSNPKGSLNMGALMLNAYYDIHTGTAFTPYIGGGVGLASAKFSKNPGLDITDKQASDATLAGQLSIGVSYTPEFWPNTDWSVGYNYFHMGGPDFKTSNGGHVTLDDLSVNSLEMGLKYHF